MSEAAEPADNLKRTPLGTEYHVETASEHPGTRTPVQWGQQGPDFTKFAEAESYQLNLASRQDVLNKHIPRIVETVRSVVKR